MISQNQALNTKTWSFVIQDPEKKISLNPRLELISDNNNILTFSLDNFLSHRTTHYFNADYDIWQNKGEREICPEKVLNKIFNSILDSIKSTTKCFAKEERLEREIWAWETDELALKGELHFLQNGVKENLNFVLSGFFSDPYKFAVKEDQEVWNNKKDEIIDPVKVIIFVIETVMSLIPRRIDG